MALATMGNVVVLAPGRSGYPVEWIYLLFPIALASGMGYHVWRARRSGDNRTADALLTWAAIACLFMLLMSLRRVAS
ncbi:MAG TPA: hypothetical protein VM869_04625 [Enhygromyxa sp.]|nr:hypothetical protein [Enhygromyxa sp.]